MQEKDEAKFNRRATEKLWKDASHALAEHLMHMSPAYEDRLAEPCSPKGRMLAAVKAANKPVNKFEFASLIAELSKENKERGELLLENNYGDYLEQIIQKDMTMMGNNGLAIRPSPDQIAR